MFFQGSVPYEDAATAAGSVYREVIENDEYGLRKFLTELQRPDSIKTIIDIGANIGFFSLHARVLFPRARIIAIEPVIDTCELLRQNLQFFNIEAYRGAIGNGEVIKLQRGQNNSTINRFTTDGNSEESITSVTLTQLFTQLRVEPPYCMKIDCEGGELWLPEDSGCGSILQGAAHLGIEAHFAYQPEEKARWLPWFEGLFGPDFLINRSSRWNDLDYTYQISRREFLRPL